MTWVKINTKALNKVVQMGEYPSSEEAVYAALALLEVALEKSCNGEVVLGDGTIVVLKKKLNRPSDVTVWAC